MLPAWTESSPVVAHGVTSKVQTDLLFVLFPEWKLCLFAPNTLTCNVLVFGSLMEKELRNLESETKYTRARFCRKCAKPYPLSCIFCCLTRHGKCRWGKERVEWCKARKYKDGGSRLLCVMVMIHIVRSIECARYEAVASTRLCPLLWPVYHGVFSALWLH